MQLLSSAVLLVPNVKYCPSGHSVSTVFGAHAASAFPAANVPRGHATQTLSSASALVPATKYLPAAHSVTVLGEHLLAVALCLCLNIPGAHAVHVLSALPPEDALSSPAGHSPSGMQAASFTTVLLP
jgi:hypothetical protein